MPRALLSAYEKTGLYELGRALVDLGWELIASGGTARALLHAGVPVTPVEEVTGTPEMLGGRVKTLHPAIHAAILTRDDAADRAELARFGYQSIDMVVCNLYPFEETISREDVTLEQAIEEIDVGGVSLIRAAAKNFGRVIVICDPKDYPHVVEQLRANGQVDGALRRALAAKAFAHTRDYDRDIHEYLHGKHSDVLPEVLTLDTGRVERLRYGENPHQEGGFYGFPGVVGPLGGLVLGGNKQLSYNNLLDLDSAWRAVELFGAPTVVIVKHLAPCGIASDASLAEAFPAALASDPVSAFGGVIAANGTVDDVFVTALGDLFIEAVAAPEFTQLAQEMLAQNRKNCRLVLIQPEDRPLDFEIRSVRAGLLAQTVDRGDPANAEWRVVTKRAPTEAETKALKFAWKACQAVKSNAIVIGIENATVGIGGGLPSRVDAARIAAEKAGERAKGAVMASDAFFPFPDAVQVGINAGVTAVISPGGSVRDAEVIAAADAAGIAMIFTGVRHFRH